MDKLALSPRLGALIPDLGGVRKLRIPASRRGKRGEARVIYFFGGAGMPIYALMIYAKVTREDLSLAGRRAIRKLVNELKLTGKEK